MTTGNEYGHRKGRSLLGGAIAFLGIVLYVNIRHDHVMTPIDWGVITFGFAFLAFALIRRYRGKK